MRYLIETTDKSPGSVGAAISFMEKQGRISIIEKGDPIEDIKARVLKIHMALEYLRNSGIDDEVMVAYIRQKGVTKSAIEAVLYHQREFFKKLGMKRS